MSDRRLAWLSCPAGVAGDMVLGSLLDAGAGLSDVLGLLDGLGLDGWSLRTEQVERGSIQATRAIVEVNDDRSSRTYADICALLDAAQLPSRVAERAGSVFARLATVEAGLHGVDLERVHFHEVGGHDAIIDVVGTAAALEVLGIDEVACSPVGLGYGAVRSAHGSLPAPAPATVALLEGFVVRGVDVAFETATPTGAALLAGLCGHSGPVPGMEVTAQGFGAGTRDLEGLANVVGVIIGTRPERSDEQVGLLEANLDDVTGERLAHALDELLRLGALDAWVTPITMKKGRPAHRLSVLCDPLEGPGLEAALGRLTGTLGVRRTLVARSVVERALVEVEVLGHPVRVKISSVATKPEFDDVVAVSRATGRTVAEIDALARSELGEILGGGSLSSAD